MERIDGHRRLWRAARTLFGGTVQDDLSPYRRRLDRINELERELQSRADHQLRAIIQILGERSRAGADPEDLLEQVFAATREASRRALGIRPHDEQLLAGIAMHEGTIAEMQTGEGKTLAAVPAVVLSALAGGGVHVLTFNDYLARRDAGWMGPIYELLGLSVGCVQEGMAHGDRQRGYRCDVTYLTAREAGFDFLRNFLCLDRDRLLDREAALAVVDEADSILIDEARIPLVIAGGIDDESGWAERMAEIAGRLGPGVDFDTDEFAHNIFLTDAGSSRVEQLVGCANLYDPANVEQLAALRNALHAGHLLHRDIDYIVRDDRVELVDDFTGRIADKRQWPDGLQAAIEAKERLHLQREGRILGSITMQHFLLSYPRLAGMTATAHPAATELATFYGLGVTVIPTHQPSRRVDHDDRVFTHRDAKWAAVTDEIARVHRTGRPVLVGTLSVAESELLAVRLRDRDIACQVLNAKNDEVEAEIIAGAGALGAVTISTNMAGRGTDIRLGSDDPAERESVRALGGLYVIGTNRHESVRVDQQLRGRAGRQGDPGSSRFFISLEDPLLERYGVRNLIAPRYLPVRQLDPVDSPILRREIARAQRIVEGNNLDIRRRLWEFSAPIEWQRKQLHEWRQDVLLGAEPLDLLERRCPERYARARNAVGGRVPTELEQRLTLVAIDRCWSDHLAEVRRIRDGIHVVKYVGKDALGEFYRETGHGFERLRAAIDDDVVDAFEAIRITPEGVDWDQEGLLGPSSTWTYLVSEDPFGTNPMLTLSSRAGFALWASILLGPLIFLWGLLLHWRRHEARAVLGSEAERDPT